MSKYYAIKEDTLTAIVDAIRRYREINLPIRGENIPAHIKSEVDNMYFIAWKMALEHWGYDANRDACLIDLGTKNMDHKFHYFEGKAGLRFAVIPWTCENTGNNGFNGCTNLEGVYISEGVKRVDAYCFYRCNNLRYIKLPSTTSQWIGEGAFIGAGNLDGAGFLEIDMTAIKSADAFPVLHHKNAFPEYAVIYVASKEIRDAVVRKTNWIAISNQIKVKE